MTAATSPVTVEDASALDHLTYAWEAAAAPDASPATGPAWLRATDGIDPRIPPLRYLIARRGPGELAALPMHLIPAAATPDADPRSYFGASPETTGGQVCCGSPETSPAAQTLASLPASDVFPALLLGSLPGYKTEILHSYWTPDLAARLIDAALEYARDQHIATIIAPWVADQHSGRALARELNRRGAVSAFWAAENYMPLRHGSLQAHLAAARSRDRYRYRQDTSESDVPKVLARLLELDVPLLCTAGFKNGQMAACCVSVEKAGRIYAKHAGFDYDTLGTRSGAHFAVVIYATLAAAYDRRAHIIEYGIGAHQAKALRGCQPRTVTSYLLTASPHVRDIFTAAATVSTPRRQAEYATPGQPSGESSRSSACCLRRTSWQPGREASVRC
jgi:hypothetical protein